MVKKTVTFSSDRLDDLSRALSVSGKTELTNAELETLITLAVDLWIDTLIGPSRPRTTTELYTTWLREVYAKHLTEEEPHERRLFGRLNFPYGQATYLARVLREEQPSSARRKALEALESELSKRLPDAKKWAKDGRGEDRMSITITKAGRRELDLLMASIIEAGTQVRPPKGEGSMGDYTVILVAAADVERLAGEAKKLADRLKTEGGTGK